MATLYLDYLYHGNKPISQYVKVIDDQNQFISIKENNNSQKSHTYLVTHEECDIIVKYLHRKFIEICDNLIMSDFNHDELNRAVDNRQFLRFMPVGSFCDFDGFHDLDCKEYTIGLIITNDYHLNGNLEIHLGYNHRISNNFNVIEKWSPSDKPLIFKKVEHQINPEVDNFKLQQRDELIHDIVEASFDSFSKSIVKLRSFILTANTFPLNRKHITPIYLDLKNRNRSRTSLQTNPERQKRISKDIATSDLLLERLHKTDYSYTDFLLWISIERHELHERYSHFNDAELTASQAYKDLVSKVELLSKPGLKEEYEQEQVNALKNIWDVVRGLHF